MAIDTTITPSTNKPTQNVKTELIFLTLRIKHKAPIGNIKEIDILPASIR